MIYKRRYIQYNELVFDGYDMVSTSEYEAEVKGDPEEYSFGHGSYDPYKSDSVFFGSGEVSLTLRFKMKKIPCEYRKHYKPFAIGQIAKPGKLWAVLNDDIVWAYARPSSISDSESARRDEYIINVDFILWEGVWHKANKFSTFLAPYNVCTFMDCKGFRDEHPCADQPLDGDCCGACSRKPALTIREDGCECCCGKITKDMALCYHNNDLQEFYKRCAGTFQVYVDCAKAQEFFGYLGTKICTKDSCSNIIAGKIYSDTEIPTSGYEIVIDGNTKDPQITINGNTNVIKGEHERLFIYSNGDVFEEDAHKRARVPLEPDQWEVAGDKYGWEFVQGGNFVVIDRGSCCGRACAYIQIDSLTI